MQQAIVADTLVSLTAVAGLLILRGTIKRGEAGSSIDRRFLFGIDVICTMMLARLLWWVSGISLFDTITIIAAGMIPLAALILSEGLLLRHAPRFLKLIAAGGALVFFVLAFLSPQFADPARIYALLLLQSFMFMSIGVLVLTRDRDSLSVAQNRTVGRIGLSLVLILPFAISDYRTDPFDTPVRLSGIAVLFLCWLAVSLGRGNLSHQEIARSFLMLFVSAVAAGVSVAWLAGFDIRTAIQATAIIMAFSILASIYNEAKTTQRDAERDSLLRYIARSTTDSPAVFLQGLQRHALVEGALILDTAALGDFDASFRACFTHDPIRKRSELDMKNAHSHNEQLGWFFEKYDATHVMLVSENPFVVVALNMPTLAASPGAEIELRAVQRVAYLLSQQRAVS